MKILVWQTKKLGNAKVFWIPSLLLARIWCRDIWIRKWMERYSNRGLVLSHKVLSCVRFERRPLEESKKVQKGSKCEQIWPSFTSEIEEKVYSHINRPTFFAFLSSHPILISLAYTYHQNPYTQRTLRDKPNLFYFSSEFHFLIVKYLLLSESFSDIDFLCSLFKIFHVYL